MSLLLRSSFSKISRQVYRRSNRCQLRSRYLLSRNLMMGSKNRVINEESTFFSFTSRRSYAVKPFNLADIGEGIAEVEILQWFVKEGDKIEEFDPICEVQSDKATVEITSPYSGTIKKLHYAESDMAKVGSPLCDIDMESSSESVATEVKEESTPEPTPPSTPVTSLMEDIVVSGKRIKVLATPAVRAMAKQHKVNISDVRGTGKDGRITKGDFLAFINGKQQPVSTPVSTATTTPARKEYIPGESHVIKLNGYARAMARKMEEALSIPLFGYCEEVELDELMKLRKAVKPMLMEKGIKITNLSFIIKICSLALKEYPTLNGSINEELTEITCHGSHNIGIAMDTPGGLIVPNIKNVQDLSVVEIAQELNRLIELARNNKVPPQDLTGGTFSLSNIGIIGGTYAKPVVVVPEVCIGALGKIQKLPRFDDNGNVVARHIMQFSWSADHRAIDGATIALFSNHVKRLIENPGLISLETR